MTNSLVLQTAIGRSLAVNAAAAILCSGLLAASLSVPARADLTGPDFARAALQAQQEGDHERAIDYFSRAIDSNELRTKDMPKAYNNLGVSYFRLRDLRKAVESFSVAIDLNDRYSVAYRNRGATYADLGAYDEALSDYDRAIRLNPEDSASFNNRGIIHKKRDEFYKAFSDFGAAIFLDPDFAEAYFNRGKTYLEQERYSLAIADLDDAIRLDGQDAAAFKYRGLAYEQTGQGDWGSTGLSARIRSWRTRGLGHSEVEGPRETSRELTCRRVLRI